MKAVIQRVSEASVRISGEEVASIGTGFLVLLGIAENDSDDDLMWLVKKIANLRVFNDDNDVMNTSLIACDGEVIVVSQFTLQASTKKGNRPSYMNAARPEIAIPLYENFVKELERAINKKVQTGKFGADMKVALVNDGPVTILMDTLNKC